MRKLVHRFLRWLTYTRFWVWLCVNVLGKVKLRWKGYPEFPIEKYDEILTLIQKDKKLNGPGVYVFVSCDTKSLSSIAIRIASRAFWSHAGFVTGKHVLEMLSPGLTYRHLLCALKESDYFAVGRVEMSSEAESYIFSRQRELIRDREQIKYDFQQFLGGPHKYCSELVYEECKRYATNPNFKPHMEYGRMVFEPDDLYRSMRIIFEYKGE